MCVAPSSLRHVLAHPYSRFMQLVKYFVLRITCCFKATSLVESDLNLFFRVGEILLTLRLNRVALLHNI